MQPQTSLPENLLQHFTLLQPKNISKKRDALSINLSGYSDVAHLMSDIIKVCILALGKGENSTHARIPSPETNITGVLSILLDLVPYEEFELLDKIRDTALNPVPPQETDWEFIRESLRITPNIETGYIKAYHGYDA